MRNSKKMISDIDNDNTNPSANFENHACVEYPHAKSDDKRDIRHPKKRTKCENDDYICRCLLKH